MHITYLKMILSCFVIVIELFLLTQVVVQCTRLCDYHYFNISGRKAGPSLGALAIPETNLRRLQATAAVPTTTKITREKNKLVIQQHKRRKSP